jgi:hypothetical protein
MKAEWPLRRSDHQMSTGDALKISATLRKTAREAESIRPRAQLDNMFQSSLHLVRVDRSPLTPLVKIERRQG